jgi:uncharacterized protein YgiM (DUF1202 family)
MKKIILLAMLCSSYSVIAQSWNQYVAIKTGLNIRDKPGTDGKVIDKIPYGTKITLLEDTEEQVKIKTEGILGAWKRVKYNNKTGYVLDTYLFSSPPPKATVKDIKNYLAQISLPFGSKLVVKSGSMNNVEEGGWELHKQLYKNGGEWHQFMGYEYGSDTYFLPDFTIQQGFLLLRMIPEFKDVFGEKDVFPSEDKIFKKGEIEYSIKVEKETFGDVPWIKKIHIEFAEGASYSFDMYELDNQLVIFYGSGV